MSNFQTQKTVGKLNALNIDIDIVSLFIVFVHFSACKQILETAWNNMALPDKNPQQKPTATKAENICKPAHPDSQSYQQCCGKHTPATNANHECVSTLAYRVRCTRAPFTRNR